MTASDEHSGQGGDRTVFTGRHDSPANSAANSAASGIVANLDDANDVLYASLGDNNIAGHDDRIRIQRQTSAVTLMRVAAGTGRLSRGSRFRQRTTVNRPYRATPPSRNGGPAGPTTTLQDQNLCVVTRLVSDVFTYKVTIPTENTAATVHLHELVPDILTGSHRLVDEGAHDAARYRIAPGASRADTLMGEPLYPTGRRVAAGKVNLVAINELAAAETQDDVAGLATAASRYASCTLVGNSAADAAGWITAASEGRDGEETTRTYAAVANVLTQLG